MGIRCLAIFVVLVWLAGCGDSTTDQAREFLVEQIGNLKGEISDFEKRLQEYGEEKRIFSVDDSNNLTLQALQGIAEKRTAAQTEVARAEATYRAVTEADPVAEEFVALLNEARKEAGLEPLELDHEQSATAQRLTPFFFASMAGRGPSLHTEMIVLGMLAGWSVEGAVESGHFTAAWVLRSTDLSELLGTAFEHPSSREALLDGEIDRIAVGGMLATAEGLDGMAALIGTYAVFSGGSHEELTQRVLDQIASARKARGQAPPRELVELDSLCEGAAAGVRSGESPEDVMNALMKASVQVLRRPVTGWIAEVRDLAAIELPDEYLDEPGLALAVSVTHQKEPDEPRGRYVVMVVFASEGLGA